MEFHILYMIQEWHTPWLDILMTQITSLGNKGFIWIVWAIICLLFPKTRKIGILMLLSLVLMQSFGNILLKPMIARERPCWIDSHVVLLITEPKDYSFPSGHTAASFAVATILRYMKAPFYRLGMILAVMIAFSRLYLFVHFPTDVLGGILLGFLCATFLYFLYKIYMQQKGIPF